MLLVANRLDGLDQMMFASKPNSKLSCRIIFVGRDDAYQELVDRLIESLPNCCFETVEIGDSDAGIEKISQSLATSSMRYEAIHILTSCAPGCLQVGLDKVDGENLWKFVNPIASWSNSLEDNANIFFHSQDLTAGEEGAKFVEVLKLLTARQVSIANDQSQIDTVHSQNASMAQPVLETGNEERTGYYRFLSDNLKQELRIDDKVSNAARKPAAARIPNLNGTNDYAGIADGSVPTASPDSHPSKRISCRRADLKRLLSNGRFDQANENGIRSPYVASIPNDKSSSVHSGLSLTHSKVSSPDGSRQTVLKSKSARADNSHNISSIIARIQHAHFRIIQVNSALGLIAGEMFLY